MQVCYASILKLAAIFCVFVNEQVNRDKTQHYVGKLWPEFESLVPEQKNVSNVLLVNRDYLIWVLD